MSMGSHALPVECTVTPNLFVAYAAAVLAVSASLPFGLVDALKGFTPNNVMRIMKQKLTSQSRLQGKASSVDCPCKGQQAKVNKQAYSRKVCAGWGARRGKRDEERRRCRVGKRGEQGVIEYLARLFGVGGVEGGGAHRVHFQESPHGPQEALMPQKQCCHLTLHFLFHS